MTFKKCPHTCPHPTTKTGSGIFWSSGGTYATHVTSQKVHKYCDPLCPAHQNPDAPSPPITEDDWDEFADKTFERYRHRDPEVLRHIPIHHLGEANQQSHPDYERFMEKRRKRQERQQAGTGESSFCCFYAQSDHTLPALAMQELQPAGRQRNPPGEFLNCCLYARSRRTLNSSFLGWAIQEGEIFNSAGAIARWISTRSCGSPTDAVRWILIPSLIYPI